MSRKMKASAPTLGVEAILILIALITTVLAIYFLLPIFLGGSVT
jgi:hypothetical protein